MCSKDTELKVGSLVVNKGTDNGNVYQVHGMVDNVIWFQAYHVGMASGAMFTMNKEAFGLSYVVRQTCSECGNIKSK